MGSIYGAPHFEWKNSTMMKMEFAPFGTPYQCVILES